MGLGKTITCVSLIAATLQSARSFGAQPVQQPQQPPKKSQHPNASHFAGAVWGMPEPPAPASTAAKDSKSKKAERDQEKLEAEYVRACRIKARSRATLIICPLSTVANWEDQFREHWRGEVTVVGGNGNCASSTAASSTNGRNTPDSADSSATTAPVSSQSSSTAAQSKPQKPLRVREGTPLKVYIYHGNARRPEPAFLADFDAVITTYATLASEFSKQNRTAQTVNEDGEDTGGGGSSDGGVGFEKGRGDPELEIVEVRTGGMSLEPKPAKKTGTKRKKPMTTVSNTEIASPLQSINWFRVVLDEAQYVFLSISALDVITHGRSPSSIKEAQTVGCRASCDLIADRRLCLTGTPVQNKLDDMFALIKFLRLSPFDDKNIWTKHISAPAKFGQREGIIRLRTIMDTVTLRRTKETRSPDGRRILALPPREDKLVRLELGQVEKEIYNQYFTESKAEFTDLTRKNQVMKNYVGILQKLLRLRQICDHKDLITIKPSDEAGGMANVSYEEIVRDIEKEGINTTRATAIWAILREAATTQCTECGGELCTIAETGAGADGLGGMDSTAAGGDGPPPSKRGRKSRGQTSSRAPTRASSPSAPTTGPRPILTRCQHLFCAECYRNSICPGWPDVLSNVVRQCSACQTELAPTDVVEIKPEMMVESSAGGGGGSGGGDGKKVKKENKEDRMKRLEKKVQEIELRLTQEQERMSHSQSQAGGSQLPQQSFMDIKPQSLAGGSQQAFKQEMDIKPQELGQIKDESDILGQFMQDDLLGHFKQEMDIFKPDFGYFGHDMDIKPTPGHSPPSSSHSPSSFFPDANGDAHDAFFAPIDPHHQPQDDEMKLEMDVVSSTLGLPPPNSGNIREQATSLLQREICEQSTKIRALIQRLLPFSLENPHSANYNPAGLDVQIVDRDGNGSADNVIKTVVL